MHFLIVPLASRNFRRRDTLAAKREVDTAAKGETKISQTNLTSLSVQVFPGRRWDGTQSKGGTERGKKINDRAERRENEEKNGHLRLKRT